MATVNGAVGTVVALKEALAVNKVNVSVAKLAGFFIALIDNISAAGCAVGIVIKIGFGNHKVGNIRVAVWATERPKKAL